MPVTVSDPAPVVVVGLGPVGATVALLLARHGVRVLAVERDLEPYPHPRAVALDDAALRVLQATGVLRAPGIALRRGGTVRLQDGEGRPLVELPAVEGTLGHPALTFFRQPELERALRARLAEEDGVELLLGTEVVGLRQDGDGATLVLRDDEDGVREQRAAWVLACDGGRSGLRRALGVRLRGLTSPRRWLVADTDDPEDGRAPDPEARGAFVFACDPRRPWVHGPLPGGAHRWELLLGPGEDAAGIERPAVVARLLRDRAQGASPVVRRAAVYAFHARVALRWRTGRVLLLGDAAHLAPPFAGQGLGAGLRDAHNVAWKLADVVVGRAPETLLGTYARERLPHVLRTTTLALGLGGVVQLRRPRAARARDVVLRGLGRVAPVRAWIARGGWRVPERVGGPLRARGALGGRAGEPAPQPSLLRADGSTAALDDVLGPGWHLLSTRGDPLASTDAATRALARALGITATTLGARGAGDDGGTVAAWIAPCEVVLLRPDRVAFGTAGAGCGGTLVRELGRVLEALGSQGTRLHRGQGVVQR